MFSRFSYKYSIGFNNHALASGDAKVQNCLDFRFKSYSWLQRRHSLLLETCVNIIRVKMKFAKQLLYLILYWGIMALSTAYSVAISPPRKPLPPLEARTCRRCWKSVCIGDFSNNGHNGPRGICTAGSG